MDVLRKLLLPAIALATAISVGAQSPALYGLDFSPYLNGQDPNLRPPVGAAQIASRMQIVAPYTRWIRSFGITGGLENIPPVARQLGLKVAAGAWIGGDQAQNAAEIANLIAAANAGQVDIAIVGSEALLRNDVTEGQLIAYMTQVRQAIPSAIPMTTADTYDSLLAHPNVIAASDVLFANFHPYWEGVSIDNAVCSLAQQYQRLADAAGGRQVIVSETGWPSAGNAVRAAVPSPANAARFFLDFVSWAIGNNIPYFYFAAFDENWKAAYEGPQGAHWGIWDENGVLKPGMGTVLGGQTSPVACDGTVGGPGTPAISLTYVPPYGSTDALEGQVLHVSPAGFGVAVYIEVAGGWWAKPTFAQPVTPIGADGSWSAPIVTGGTDSLATHIAAFLIPSTFSPPQLSGAGALPDSITANSAAQVQVSRTQNAISGVVTDSLNHPVSGVTISAGALGAAVTAPDGKYSFFNLPASGSATLTPSYPNFVFAPTSTTLEISSGTQTANFSGGATVDLAIISALSATSIQAGANLTATVVVSNGGIAGASDAVATVSFPGSVTVLSAAGTRGTCSVANQLVTCDVGALPPTAYATITVAATPTAAGSFNIAASVSGPDADSNPANNTTSQALTVQAPPVLIISKTHVGNFAQGQSNASYVVTVSNQVGAGTTSGTVTVTEYPPAALTAVSMTGVGWFCLNNTCTRGDGLAGGSSYPAITVTVSVASNAPLQVTNQVGVAGGGSAAANAFDLAFVNPASSCTFSIDPAGAVFSANGTSAGGFYPSASQSFAVTPSANCQGVAWTAASADTEWLTISSGAGGTGTPVTIGYIALSNPQSAGRSAGIAVSGPGAASAVFTVSEAASSRPLLERQVIALYQGTLGREPDTGGFNFWTCLTPAPPAPCANLGIPGLGLMVDLFLTSAEGQNTSFQVLAIYQAVLGRLPTFAEWSNAVIPFRLNDTPAGWLAAGTALANSLAGSSGATLVNAVYHNALGRDPTAAELTNGLSTVAGGGVYALLFSIWGTTPPGLDPAVPPSATFTNTEFRNTTNPLFVQLMYYAILGRDPDPGGFAFWLGVANGGGPGIYFSAPPTRQLIEGPGAPGVGFVGSPEFQGRFQ